MDAEKMHMMQKLMMKAMMDNTNVHPSMLHCQQSGVTFVSLLSNLNEPVASDATIVNDVAARNAYISFFNEFVARMLALHLLQVDQSCSLKVLTH